VAADDSGSPVPSSPQKRPDPASRQFAIALELPFVLVSAIVLGGLFGYLLDRWLHTKPVLMLILGGVGFYAGVRDVLRRLTASSDGNG
jgi:F0F1-type ATP synthase assembly protein I